jgi:soluble lytic murein transglycosylase
MPATAQAVANERGIPYPGVRSLEDPKLNIYLALHYIKELKTAFPQNKHMLIAYNMGPSALQKKLKNGDEFSYAYYEKVMGMMEQFQREAKRGNGQWL